MGKGVLPYAPVVEALRPLGRLLGPAELERVLGGARTELARLVPELDPVGAPSLGGVPGQMHGGVQQYRSGEHRDLCAARALRPRQPER
jgi:hypothetical protein